MSAIDITEFVLVIVGIFIFPFILFKLLAWLKTSIESRKKVVGLKAEGQIEYRTLKDNIRYFAFYFIFVGILAFVVVLLNDVGSGKPYYLVGSLLILFGALGVWMRLAWSVFFIVFPFIFYIFYAIYLDWHNFTTVMVIFFIAIPVIRVIRSIREIKTFEVEKEKETS
jgi:hypothetical protein